MKLKMKSAVITAMLVSAVFIAVVSVFAGCKNTAQNPQNVPQAVTGVKLNKTALTLNKGASEKLTATVLPANAANKTVTWTSDKKAVADVDADGRVTAKKTGKAIITVTTQDGNKTAQCTVTVLGISVTGVTLDKTSLTLNPGASEKLIATVLPENAANKTVTWASDKPDIAEVDADGWVTAKKAGQAVITVTTEDGGKTAQCTVTVSRVAVTGVTLNKTSLALSVGSSETLTATVLPSNATNKRVTWASSKPDIADVDANGAVTAKKAGQAVITVTTEDGGKSAQCTVTASIISVTGVKLNKTSLALSGGSSETLTATVFPSNATNKKIAWSSSKPDIAEVDANGAVTAKNRGQAVITVTTEDGNKTAQCAVTVRLGVTGVTLNKTSLTLSLGHSETLTATVLPSNAANKRVTWSSNKPDIAKVDYEGKVTAKETGIAVITVTTKDGGKTAQCTVTVSRVAVTGITLDKKTLNIGVGTAEDLRATVTPANASNKKVIWSSSSSDIAEVSSWGTVRAKKAGQAVITATTEDGSKTAQCTVTVSSVELTGITLDKNEMNLIAKEEGKITVKFQPASAGVRKVVWSSDNERIAWVGSYGSNGKYSVYAKKEGQTVITAKTEDGRFSAQCTVNVSKIAVTGITLDKTSITLMDGAVETLTATVAPENATYKNVTWASDKPDIADVDENGKVEAYSPGQAVITATTEDGSLTAQCTVTVQRIPKAVLVLDTYYLNYYKNGEIEIKAETEDGSAIKVWGCEENTLASDWVNGAVLKVKGDRVFLIGKIIKLSCSGNWLKFLSVDDLPSLQELDCAGNRLPALDVSGFASLQKLNCKNNELKELKLQGCTSLQELDCSRNKLEALDVGGFPLQNLNCSNNKLTSLNVQGFSSLINLNCSDNGNIKTVNSPEPLEVPVPLDLNVQGCTSLKMLNCRGSKIKTLNVQSLTSLQELNCAGNELTSLDVHLPSLISLSCDSNKLTSLNVQGSTSLISLSCNWNKLTTINLQGLNSLRGLNCSSNQLTSLDVQNHPSLQVLTCYGNKLTTLNLQGLADLYHVQCFENQLTSLNVQGCTKLTEMFCSNNQLTELNLQGLPYLITVFCSINKITDINAQGCPSLRWLACNKNQLVSLNVLNCPKLEGVDLTANKLSKAAFTKLLADAPDRGGKERGELFLYTEETGIDEGNYKEFTSDELSIIKNKNWDIYKLDSSGEKKRL